MSLKYTPDFRFKLLKKPVNVKHLITIIRQHTRAITYVLIEASKC